MAKTGDLRRFFLDESDYKVIMLGARVTGLELSRAPRYIYR
jgi:hypothetical protein